jgi:sugar lactone lactonase YvrE
VPPSRRLRAAASLALTTATAAFGCQDAAESSASEASASESSSATTSGTTGESSTSQTPTTTAAETSETSTGTTDGEAPLEELLVADFSGDAVARFDAATGALLGTLSRGPELDGALGMTLSPDGALLYVASEEANAVLRFDSASGDFVDALIIDDPRSPGDETNGLMGPGAVIFGPDYALYVSSFDGDAVLRYDGTTGAFVDLFVTEGAGGLNGPDAGMVFGPDGDLYIPSYYSDQVLRFDGLTGEALGAFTPDDGSLKRPRTLLFVGPHLLVTSEASDEVVRYDAETGAYVDALVPAGLLSEPAGMAQTADGTLMVVSLGAQTVEAFDPTTGEHLGTRVTADSGLTTPTHLIVRPAT